MQRVRHRAGAVVAAVVPLAVAAAVLVRGRGDAVRGRDDAPDDARAGGAPAAAALEDDRAAAMAERAPRRGADDAVRGQAVAALEGPDRALRGRAEDAVGGDAERALERTDGGAAAEVAARAMCPVRPGAPQRGPRGRADDPVGGEAVAALEALDRALGRGAEDAVRGEAEPALHLRHARSVGPALERRVGWLAAGGEQGNGRHAGDDARAGAAACCVRHVPSVHPHLRLSGRLRGELTGSRAALRRAHGGDSPLRPVPGRSGSPVRRPRGAAIRRPSFYQSGLLPLHDVLQTGGQVTSRRRPVSTS